ncbi:MAG TPA: cytochrome c biogenesis protein CcdA [Methyloceanibacter sp.]|nr:cytochrome c biogenesis protein CcdA [Methyloceanibacter sp.]
MELSNIGVAAAFAAGIISFLSPCVLPLVPGYVSYIAGRSVPTPAAPGGMALAAGLPAAFLSIFFVLGFATVFIILGASATALAQLLQSYRYELGVVGGVVIVGFGLFTLGLIRPVWLQRDARFHLAVSGGRPAAAYLLGLAFAFGWTPCIGPILGAILTVGAASATVTDGITLLGIYSLGLGIPFLLAALFTDRLMAKLKLLGRAGRFLKIFAGAIMILMGIGMITGQLSVFAYWLLETFPILGQIG